MKKITIIIVDDHRLIREMWRTLFLSRTDIEVIGENGKFDEAIEMIKIKKPDIVLLNINLSDVSGLDTIPFIRKYSAATSVIIVSMLNHPAYAKETLRLGAKAYITKNSSHKEMFKAIDEVMEGRVYICTEIKEILSDQLFQDELNEPSVNDLSLREIEIIKLIRDGFSSKEISVMLNISVRTVEVHRHNVFKKLKLKNTASLLKFIKNTDLNFA